MIIVYVTCKDMAEAKKICRHLLDKKLVACGNRLPSKTMYRWKGKLVDGDEVVLLLKTVSVNFEKIQKEIKKIHSYELPAIIKLNCDATEEFEKWIKDSLRIT